MIAPDLQVDIVKTEELTTRQKEEMFVLMQGYFEEVRRDMFESDLAEKDWVVRLLETGSGRVRGFSTLMIMKDEVAGVPVRAFYSGDTIIHRSCWRAFSLERRWIPFVFSHVSLEPQARWYWFLLCKGYRTFRYLPIYFKRYLPSPGYTATFEQDILNHLATKKFGNAYDAREGVIRRPQDYRLRPGVGDITDRKMKNRHISYFANKNPGWKSGAELACLVELKEQNLRPAFLRVLKSQGA